MRLQSWTKLLPPKKLTPYGKIIPHSPVTMLKHEIVFLVTQHHPAVNGGGRGGVLVGKRLQSCLPKKVYYVTFQINKKWNFKRADFQVFLQLNLSKIVVFMTMSSAGILSFVCITRITTVVRCVGFEVGSDVNANSRYFFVRTYTFLFEWVHICSCMIRLMCEQDWVEHPVNGSQLAKMKKSIPDMSLP